eukprot:6979513-Prorocentrum_lima.AAC.1
MQHEWRCLRIPHSKHAGLVKVQEGRSKSNGVLTTSASLHGLLGTQLWIHPDVAPFVLFPSLSLSLVVPS